MAGDELGTPPGGRFETFDANRWFVVVRDDDGYEAAAARWRILTKQARREGGVWLDRLLVVVLVALGLWVVSSAVPALQFLLEEDDGGVPFPGNPGEPLWERIVYAVSAVSFDVGIAATIAYLVVWMDRRRRAS